MNEISRLGPPDPSRKAGKGRVESDHELDRHKNKMTHKEEGKQKISVDDAVTLSNQSLKVQTAEMAQAAEMRKISRWAEELNSMPDVRNKNLAQASDRARMGEHSLDNPEVLDDVVDKLAEELGL
ncbi:hypothetical protein JYU14_04830 [Simkania negevensis]|uniref:Anti-sigma-28 factor FlgM C-terminal domain-containing protein n=1 Tax=Simkania negevensis TaxID=83561 RepID=A0ABS3AT58_9BACT|nr:hypothetical protein [Simkania negevensis]